MIIKSLEYRNFRQFKGQKKVDFAIDKKKNVTIMLGDNTHGKTTLLQMFNWCLYNEAFFGEDAINPNFLLNYEVSDKMQNGDREEVKIEIVLEHRNKEYTITRRQKYIKINGKSNFDNNIFKIAYKDLETGVTDIIDKEEEMTNVINSILSKDLSDYFFYDTEQVKRVSERKDLSNAVQGLLGLSTLSNAKNHLGKEETKTSVIGSFYEELKLNDDSKAAKAYRAMTEAEDNRKKMEEAIDITDSELNKYKEQKQKLENKIRALEETTKLQEQIDTINGQMQDKKKELEESKDKFLTKFNKDSVWFFAHPLLEQTKDYLEKSEIDDKGISDVTAKTIEELIENGVCLCGTKIEKGNDAHKNLLKMLEYVPPESIGTTIKHFKDDIELFERNSYEEFYDLIGDEIQRILQSNRDVMGYQEKLDNIKSEIEGKETAKIYQFKLNEIEDRIEEKERKRDGELIKMGEYEAQKNDYKYKYDSLIEKQNKGSEIRKYINYAKAVYDWVNEYYEEQAELTRKELQEYVNDCFQKMYHGERKLEIDEKYNTILYTEDTDGENKRIADNSEGLKRVRNFAFITGLVEMAKHKTIKAGDGSFDNEPYPLVMDAPFSDLDDTHIKNISKQVPAVAEQVIMFVMEKDWNYAKEEMMDRVGKKYNIEQISEYYSKVK